MNADFFDPNNKELYEQRQQFAKMAWQDVIDFLMGRKEDGEAHDTHDCGKLAILDATNSTKSRRKWMMDMVAELPIRVLFIESICTDETIVDQNILRTKVKNADYRHMSTDEAFTDFKHRIANYEARSLLTW